MEIKEVQPVQILEEAKHVHESEIKAPSTDYGLHQSFNKDVMEDPSTEAREQAIAFSLWNWFASWWPSVKALKPEAKLAISSDSSKAPISYMPELDEPDSIEEDKEIPPFIPTGKASAKNGLSPGQIEMGLSLMSERTIERIMEIILQAQLELETENANVAEGTYSTFLECKKIKEKAILDVKETLAKDEKVTAYFKSAQNLAIAASFVCGLAAAAISFGVLTPIGGAIGGVIGATFISAVTSLGKSGPLVSAAFTGITTGGKAYYQRRLNEDKAWKENLDYQDQTYGEYVDKARERIFSIADTDGLYKERMIQLMKRQNKMTQFVLQN